MEDAAMQNHPPSSILHPRRILVRGVNWLGDAVMTTPALLRLRERFPEAHITLLTPEKLRDLWLHHPSLDDVLTFRPGESALSVARRIRTWHFDKGQIDIEGEMTRQSLPRMSETIARGLDELTAKLLSLYAHCGIWSPKLFDLAFVLPNSPRAAFEVRLAKIPQRIGYARPWRNWLLTLAVPTRPGHTRMHKRSVSEIQRLIGSPQHATRNTQPAQAHQIHEYLHLAAALGANPEPLVPTLAVTLEEVGAAKKKFGLDQIATPILGLNPGAEYGPAKRWPADRFIAAAQEIQRRTNCVWLILGGEAETALAGHIASALRTPHSALRNLSGQTSLRELMALLKSCRVLLTNDTGPMHVAAALGTPVVAPFGSTSPEMTGPGLPGDSRHHLLKSNAPCAPCFLRECPIDFRCMNGISVERVVEAVVEALKR